MEHTGQVIGRTNAQLKPSVSALLTFVRLLRLVRTSRVSTNASRV